MTHEKIIALANEAAQAAMDISDEDYTPTAVASYEFIRMMAYEADDQTDEQANAAYDEMALTKQEWHLFSAAFQAKLAELRTPQGVK